MILRGGTDRNRSSVPRSPKDVNVRLEKGGDATALATQGVTDSLVSWGLS